MFFYVLTKQMIIYYVLISNSNWNFNELEKIKFQKKKIKAFSCNQILIGTFVVVVAVGFMLI